jgi:hypothetical protein
MTLSDATVGSTMNGSITASALNNSDEGIDDGELIDLSVFCVMLS